MAVVSSSNNYLLNNTFVINQDTVGATDSPQLFFLRDHGSGAAIAGGDFLFQMVAVASDGTTILPITSIESVASAVVGPNQIGGNLLFYTTADTHLAVPGIRMQISDAGNVTINTPVSGVGLTINGGGLTSTGTTTLSSLSYGVLVAGATGVISAPVGTINYVLTSNGAGASPTFQALPASGISLTGDSGGALGPASSFTITGSTSGAVFAGSGTTLTESFNYLALPTTTNTGNGQIKINSVPVLHTYGTNNTFVGASSGNVTLATVSAYNNTAIGYSSLKALTGSSYGNDNTACGQYALSALTGGHNNTALGSSALRSLTGDAAGNCSIGGGSSLALASGQNNCVMGWLTGNAYTAGESSNILLGALIYGTNGESNTLRIGAGTGSGSGEINKAYIAGIHGITVTPDSMVVMSSGEQLGTVTYTPSTAFTPVLVFGAGTNHDEVYTVQTGSYMRMGGIVFFTCKITVSSIGTDTGVATVTGLPIAAASETALSVKEVVAGAAVKATISGTTISLYIAASGAAFTNTTMFYSVGSLTISGSYLV